MKKTKILAAIILFLTIYSSSASAAYAQTFNFSISPSLIQVTIKPGKGITHAFKIKNNYPESQDFVVRLIPIAPGDDKGHPKLLLDSHPEWLNFFSLANSKITLNQPFTMDASREDQLVLSLKVPTQTLPGDYYALLSVMNASDSSSPQPASPKVGGGIGALVLISVSDQDPPLTQLNIDDFQTLTPPLFTLGDKKFYDNLTPISFSAKIKNSGIHLAEIDGFFKIMQGKNALTTDPLIPTFVLAGGEKVLMASTSATTLTYQPRFVDIGTAQAQIKLNTTSGSVEKNLNIVFIPIRLIMGLVVALILFLVIKTKIKPTY